MLLWLFVVLAVCRLLSLFVVLLFEFAWLCCFVGCLFYGVPYC